MLFAIDIYECHASPPRSEKRERRHASLESAGAHDSHTDVWDVLK